MKKENLKKKVIFSILTFALVCFVIELFSWTIIKFISLKDPTWLRAEGQFQKTEIELSIHPYFGVIPSLEYLSSKKIHLWNQISDLNRNNFGLLEKQDFGRNFNRAEKFHLAIVGGSVASQVFNHLKNKEEGFRTKEGKQVEFVNLSYGGYKQPQQLLILTYLLSLGVRIDGVFNIDGFNEVALPIADQIPNLVHWSFPRNWGKINSFLQREVTNYFALNQLIQSICSKGSYSATIRLLAVLMDKYLMMKDRESVEEKSGEVLFNGPLNNLASKSEYLDEVTENWANSSFMIHKMLSQKGISYVHFLQPNLHDEGSKKISGTELGLIKSENVLSWLTSESYERLRLLGNKLQKAGVRAVDLTKIFKNEARTVYIDNCCHFNELGLELLTQQIESEIIRMEFGQKIKNQNFKLNNYGKNSEDSERWNLLSRFEKQKLKLFSGSVEFLQNSSVNLEGRLVEISGKNVGYFDHAERVGKNLEIFGWSGKHSPLENPEMLLVLYDKKPLQGVLRWMPRPDLKPSELVNSGFRGVFPYSADMDLRKLEIFAIYENGTGYWLKKSF